MYNFMCKIGMNDSYYENILNKINGVLWPGGTANFNKKKGYADAGAAIYRIAKKINDRGEYFPILSINLGFELLTYVAANGVEHRIACSSQNLPLPLEFTTLEKPICLKQASPDILKILAEDTVTSNSHHYCVTMKELRRVQLIDEFRVLSLNHDEKGLEFISTLEHKCYPFYGLHFHPEKNLYEWVIGKKIPHRRNAILVAQYFANFFVDEARKNLHEFATEQKAKQSLIYNYPVTYTALLNTTSFQQLYMFKKSDRDTTLL